MKIINRVLIIGPDQNQSDSLSAFLGERGYSCVCMTDIAAVAGLADLEEYDLLIADIDVSVEQDIEAMKAIEQKREDMPILVITSQPFSSASGWPISFPVPAYLTRPVDLNQLSTLVSASLLNARANRFIHQYQKRQQEWMEKVSEEANLLRKISQPRFCLTIESFLDLAFQNIFETMMDLKNMTEFVLSPAEEASACHLLNCPRLVELQDALLETVEVLEKTKNSFKSKELGDLRRKLESVLHHGRKLTKGG